VEHVAVGSITGTTVSWPPILVVIHLFIVLDTSDNVRYDNEFGVVVPNW
jgi:hypothetical protein